MGSLSRCSSHASKLPHHSLVGTGLDRASGDRCLGEMSFWRSPVDRKIGGGGAIDTGVAQEGAEGNSKFDIAIICDYEALGRS